MFKLDELLKATGGRLISGRKDITIQGISTDSRTIKKGECFIAIKGNNFDGYDFVDEAIKKGANCIIRRPRPPKILAGPSCVVAETTPAKNLGGSAMYCGGNHEPRKAVFIEVKDTQKALGDIARFQRNKFNIPVIAVTGSNGKTTTKEMIAWVLSPRFKVLKNEGTKNNQIGLPLTLLKLNRNCDIVVLELGSNHPGEIGYLAKICQPNTGVITNIGPAHLEYFCNLKGVFREKYTLIKNLKKPYLAILNSDDILLRRQVLKDLKKPFIHSRLDILTPRGKDEKCGRFSISLKETAGFSPRSFILGFGIKNHTDFFASDVKNIFGKLEFLVQKNKFTLRTAGYYNVYNALAAIAIARIFGMEYKDIAKRLAIFDFPQGRLKVRQLNQVKFIDDTYNSNPVSLKQALAALRNFKTKGRKIFVMGDMLELGRRERLFHSQIGRRVRGGCDVFITVGRLSALAAEAAMHSGFNIKNIFTCESIQQAQDVLFNKISPGLGDVVLVKGSRLMKMEEIMRV